ncbi:MAG: tRNA (adenosine(37)-N6)-dimethylallyltransferase MiaA [Candidatus Levybacteria bacterium]|nr:tRNA (adenosine(37)-N6)-dimethylallyltransferase MiaA [Candidatus Levybacteria bacterium]
MNKILVISGPTAAGKTKLTFKLAKLFDGELISADSRQVYKGMDIGTGKEFCSEIPTWGCDVVRPNEEWSAAHFVKLADKLIFEIQSRGKLPIVVGGTGLYIANLLNPPDTLNIPPDRKLRKELEKLSVAELQDRLKKITPRRFEGMNESDQQNPRRLVRAIEIAILASKGPTFLKRSDLIRCSDSLHIALTAPIDILDKRIEQRVTQRLDQGVKEEVSRLVKKYGWNSALSFTIGYKEWRPYLSGQCSIEEVIKNWTIHEKQYARRQLVWMAKYSPDRLFDIGKLNYYQDIEAYVGQWYHRKE